MRKLATLLILLALAVPALAQDTNMVINPVAAASVGKHPQAMADVHFNNMVAIDARHCAAYTSWKRQGLWHLFQKKQIVDAEACAADPTTLFDHREMHNIVTDVGFNFVRETLGCNGGEGAPCPASRPAACNYVAVTDATITPAAGDTTLSGEIAANGLSRAIGTFAKPSTYVYTITKVFTATGTQSSRATGLFNAASTGTMCYEVNYTGGPVVVNNTDTLTVTWTITLS